MSTVFAMSLTLVDTNRDFCRPGRPSRTYRDEDILMNGKLQNTRPTRAKSSLLDPDDTAIRVLGCLATDPERLERFLALTGLGPDTIRTSAKTPGFLQAVLDHVAAHEFLLVQIAAELGVSPAAIAEAQARGSRFEQDV
jgi:hypothetical protein